MPETNDGFAQRHIGREGRECQRVPAAMLFDPDCDRCSKINKVVHLRRKNTDNGCSIEEALTASIMATRLIEQYKLTKGEIIDREYDKRIIVQKQAAQHTYHDQYGAAKARHTYKPRQKWYTWDERRDYDEGLTDE